jgi:hypothetical protein
MTKPTNALFKLHRGPYNPPALRVGDRTACLYRGTEVVITSWTAARIPWPRCRALGVRGGSGILINDELLRAIRAESAEALKYWFGVGTRAVWSWRKAFGISQWGTEGSRLLLQQVSEAGAAKQRGRKLPREQVERRRRTALELGLRPTGRWTVDGWRRDEEALLGTAADSEIAARIGRSAEAVRCRRAKLGIANRFDRRRRGQERK